MAIESECEGCGVQLRVADEHAGRQARCPKCGSLYTVPGPATPKSPVRPAPLPPDPMPTSVNIDSPPTGGTANNDSIGWFAKMTDGQEYGPVGKAVLDQWVAEGRVNGQCQLRSPDSEVWQSAGEIYPQLAKNPFRDNPYSSPRPASEKGTHYEPHRGALVLVLAILGFLVCVFFSPAAWIMGRNDLKKMDKGTMDPEGRTLTQVGMILGIIQSCLLLIGGIIVMLWFVLIIGASAM